MHRPGDVARAATIAYSVKGQLLTSFVDVLKDHSRWDDVHAELGEESRAVVRSQPLASDWISGKALTEVCCITYDLYGSNTFREYAYLGTKRSTIRYLMPAIEATMRLFGVTPPTLLSRINQFVSQSTKGIELSFTKDSDHSGTVSLHYPGSRALPDSVLESTVGSLMSVFDFTKTKGAFSKPQWDDKSQNAAKFTITWQPK